MKSVKLGDLRKLDSKTELKEGFNKYMKNIYKKMGDDKASEYFNTNPEFREMLKNIRRGNYEKVDQVLNSGEINSSKYLEYSGYVNTISQAVSVLQQYNVEGKFVFIDFNGTKLYSDTVTLDSAYLSITGLNKADYDKKQEDWSIEYNKSEELAKKEANLRIPEWIEKGKQIIDNNKIPEFEKIVNIRANDIYHGLELDCFFKIMEMLNDGKSIKTIKEYHTEEGHSGRSDGLVRLLLNNFGGEKGKNIVNYL